MKLQEIKDELKEMYPTMQGFIEHTLVAEMCLKWHEKQVKNCSITNVVDSQFIEPKKEKVFEITRLPELPEMWVDPNEPVFNQQKHDQTCAKNRKKRKRR